MAKSLYAYVDCDTGAVDCYIGSGVIGVDGHYFNLADGSELRAVNAVVKLILYLDGDFVFEFCGSWYICSHRPALESEYFIRSISTREFEDFVIVINNL